MSLKNLYDNLIYLYKEDFPESLEFDKNHFINYIDEHKGTFIHRAFNLTSDIKIEDIEVDYVFSAFKEYFNTYNG